MKSSLPIQVRQPASSVKLEQAGKNLLTVKNDAVMLEYACLHVGGWTQTTLPDSSSAWTRLITDSAAKSLGFVRFAGDTGSWWFSWLRKVRLEVFETEDASHLMSLVR